MDINERIANLESRIAKLEEKDREQLLTVKEVATLLKVSPSVVYAGIRSAKIPARDIMGVLRIRKGDLLDHALTIKKYRQYEVNLNE